MAHFRHILFPVDFSPACVAFLPSVERMAKRFDAQLSLLHVLEVPATWYARGDTGMRAWFDLPGMTEDCQRLLSVFGPTSLFRVERTVMEGDPASCIAAYAAQQGVDLIMMPTNGHGARRNQLLGSVAAKVLHDAACPVWTGADLTPQEEIRCILCAVDEWPEAHCVLEQAWALSHIFEAHLVVMHAVPEITDGHLADSFRQAALSHISSLQTKARASGEAVIATRDISRAVRETAEGRQAGLVVIGRGLTSHTSGRLGTNAYPIIRDSPCPVLSF